MATIERSVWVPYAPEQMYDLVRDVGRYPEFLNWCESSEVHHEGETELEASITVALGGLRQTFRTRNTMDPPWWMTLSLVDGPFRALEGRWSFLALGDLGCKVTLQMEFEFASRVLSSAFSKGFSQVAERLVSDFGQRARYCYEG